MLIGLTGKYCAGKNYIAALLEKRGIPVLDVDKLGHQVLEIEKEKIFAQFGSDLQKTDGSVNRKLLGERVYGKAEKLAQLEEIVHPGANRLTDEWINERKRDRACIINAALLHKSSVFDKLDLIILVTAPFLTRFFRARRRDKLPFRDIFRRFSSQNDFNKRYLSVNSSSIYAEIHKVENPGLNSKLECQIDRIMERITNG